MRKTVLATAMMIAGAASAQANDASASVSTMPAVATSSTVNPAAPVAGRNSFTERQARDRIATQGYTDVSPLKKDADGIWRGTALLSGKKVGVSLDYQGNVTAK